MAKNFKPKLVISLHGIRTHGKWQKTLSEVLSSENIPIKNYDFGFFNLIKFLIPHFREKKIDEFYNYYSNILNEKKIRSNTKDYRSYPSVIAHSFGSYIIGYCLEKYPDIKFDKIILFGCILPDNFDWSTLIANEQIHFIRNEYSKRDIWSKIVNKVIKKAGSSGAKGFNIVSNYVIQEHFENYKHTTYSQKPHMMSHWLPFLFKEPPLYHALNGTAVKGRSAFLKIFKETTKFDDEEFEKFAEYQSVSYESALSWIDINPDIYTFLVDRKNKTRGYINAMPVTEETFKVLKSGFLQDNEITCDNLTTYENYSKLKLYFMSIAIDKEIKNFANGLYTEPFEILINGLIWKLYRYAVYKKIIIEEIVAIGWTTPGKRLCNIFGMKQIGVDKSGHPIYHVDFSTQELQNQRTKYPIIGKLLSEYQSIKGD